MADPCTLYQASEKDVPVLSELAHAIWWPTYQAILSKEQIAFMLQQMYSKEALEQQIQNDCDFYLLECCGQIVGFMGIGKHERASVLRIEKLYIAPHQQKSGLGKRFIAYAKSLALKRRQSMLELNVNRNNPAVAFYLKMGFRIVQEVDIPYFQFFMNDYIMQLEIDPS